ncbi:MAG: AgmX/PglI C-terminal domain-containing protein [Myxococcota bacterium]
MTGRRVQLGIGLLMALGCMGSPVEPAVSIAANLPAAENAVTVPLSRFAWTDAEQGRTHYAVVEVSAEGVRFDGELVTPLEGGRVDERVIKGYLIMPLYEAMLKGAEGQKEQAYRAGVSPAGFSGAVLLAIDKAAAAGTAQQVLYTAGQAQFGALFMMVDDADAPAAAAPTAGGRSGPISVQIDRNGEVMVTNHAVVKETGLDGLGQALSEAVDGADGVTCVAVESAQNAPWGRVVAVLDVMRDDDDVLSMLATGGSAARLDERALPAATARPLDADAQVSVIRSQLPSIALPGEDIRPGRCVVSARKSSALRADLSGGIGGLIGEKGTQIGADGFGSGGLGTSGAGGLGAPRLPVNDVVKHEEPTITGPLDAALIKAVILRHQHQIRYCYARERSKDPSLAGRIVVDFAIAPDGHVSTVAIQSSTMGAEAVEQCISGRFQRMMFPAPEDGAVVSVRQPFFFVPG